MNALKYIISILGGVIVVLWANSLSCLSTLSFTVHVEKLRPQEVHAYPKLPVKLGQSWDWALFNLLPPYRKDFLLSHRWSQAQHPYLTTARLDLIATPSPQL